MYCKKHPRHKQRQRVHTESYIPGLLDYSKASYGYPRWWGGGGGQEYNCWCPKCVTTSGGVLVTGKAPLNSKELELREVSGEGFSIMKLVPSCWTWALTGFVQCEKSVTSVAAPPPTVGRERDATDCMEMRNANYVFDKSVVGGLPYTLKWVWDMYSPLLHKPHLPSSMQYFSLGTRFSQEMDI